MWRQRPDFSISDGAPREDPPPPPRLRDWFPGGTIYPTEETEQRKCPNNSKYRKLGNLLNKPTMKKKKPQQNKAMLNPLNAAHQFCSSPGFGGKSGPLWHRLGSH